MEYTFRKGLIDGLPVCVGYLSVAFAFGIFAVGYGFSIAEAVMISMFNVTSAGQLAAIPIIASGGLIAELAVAQLVINLRYALMSVSLSQRLDHTVRLRDRFLIAFMNTDEVFAIASAQRDPVGRRYLYGLILTPYLGWSLGTLLGAIAGDILPSMVTAALGIAIYGMFIAIVTPAARADRATAVCVLIAAALSCIFYYTPVLSSVPSGFVIIICAIIAAGIMAVVSPVPVEAEAEVSTNE